MYFIVLRKIHFLNLPLWKIQIIKCGIFVTNFIIGLKSTINRQLSDDRLTFRWEKVHLPKIDSLFTQANNLKKN